MEPPGRQARRGDPGRTLRPDRGGPDHPAYRRLHHRLRDPGRLRRRGIRGQGLRTPACRRGHPAPCGSPHRGAAAARTAPQSGPGPRPPAHADATARCGTAAGPRPACTAHRRHDPGTDTPRRRPGRRRRRWARWHDRGPDGRAGASSGTQTSGHPAQARIAALKPGRAFHATRARPGTPGAGPGNHCGSIRNCACPCSRRFGSPADPQPAPRVREHGEPRQPGSVPGRSVRTTHASAGQVRPTCDPPGRACGGSRPASGAFSGESRQGEDPCRSGRV